MIYKLNGIIFNINQEHLIEDVNYPRNWFLDASNREAMGITEEADPAPPVPIWEEVKAQRISSLWQAAHDYEYLRISGMAIGLLTIGVIQQLPKSLAVAAWSANIWDTYYIRKSAIADNTQDNLDFSICGEIPYTIPELRVEIGM